MFELLTYDFFTKNDDSFFFDQQVALNGFQLDHGLKEASFFFSNLLIAKYFQKDAL